MISNRLEERHWVNVTIRYATDLVLVLLGYLTAFIIRFPGEWPEKFLRYWPSIVIGALFLSSARYIVGHYSRPQVRINLLRRALMLAGIVLLASVVVLGASYAQLVSPLGRGVTVLSIGFVFLYVYAYQVAWQHWYGLNRIRVALLVGTEQDENEARAVIEDCKGYFHIVGVVTYKEYEVFGDLCLLGNVLEIAEIAKKAKLDRILCSNSAMGETTLFQKFCQLRYMGVAVMPIIGIYEEFHQFCPTNLVTPEWLLQASTAPQVLYIRKMKRAFDIVLSLIGLALLGPILLLAIAFQRIFEKGPVFYRQKRLGRFGREFEVIKLRTMVPDAEKAGARWAAEDDPRVTPLGRFFRKYRIDEIPQLLNVLRGEMSFVGPRPERQEFAEKLEDEVPFFLERLLIQPGLTGWAQVCYPYGSCVEDSRRKLEYDLYYIKHMSLFFDLFVLLDTVRIILRGGSRRPRLLRVAQGCNLIEEEKTRHQREDSASAEKSHAT